MNKMILGLAAAAATLTAAAVPSLASAQGVLSFSYSVGPAYGSSYGYAPAYGYSQGYNQGYGQSYGYAPQVYGYGYNNRVSDWDRDGIPDRAEWNQDRDHDGRLDQYDRYDNRRYVSPRYVRRSPPIYGGYNGYDYR